ncbi:MAG: DUF2267 domain-containing protein [Salinarimonadaceae bacterium]|nr:MAG: DUF2267 domain-containing protein [Salinarimonadaceae bacterium]
MEELVSRITAVTGLDADTALKAVGLILSFLEKEGPADEVAKLVEAMPEARAAMAAGEAAASGGGMGMMGGMMGGGVMALGGKLMQIGVPMDQMKPLARELLAYGREHAGEDAVGSIVASVPGLAQFV